jgi:hypothetical protein
MKGKIQSRKLWAWIVKSISQEADILIKEIEEEE